MSEAAVRERYRTAHGLEPAIARVLCDDGLAKAVVLVADDKPPPTGPSLNDHAVRCYHHALFTEKKKRANAEASRQLRAEFQEERKARKHNR